MTDGPLRIAVFIDFDNIEIGVKSTLNSQFDVGPVLEALKERGEVVSKVAYADWKRAGDYSRALAQHAIKMVQRSPTPGGDKNGADINLALDALEMAFTHDHINAYVIVGGDSDFVSLVEKLKQYGKKVIVVGGRAFTSNILQQNCHEFIAYENLVGVQGARRQADRGRAATQVPLSQALPLVRRALELLSEREVSPQIGLLKSTLLQLDPTFSERSYGTGTFRDFAEKLAAAGLVELKHTGRNLLVELKDDAAPAAVADEAVVPGNGAPAPAEPAKTKGPAAPPQADPERLAEGVREVRRLLQTAPGAARWPMYVRNVRQVLRSVDSSFDERRYAASGIMELLRACQRENLLRLERDRRGALRVFPGTAMARPSVMEGVIADEAVRDEPQAVPPIDSIGAAGAAVPDAEFEPEAHGRAAAGGPAEAAAAPAVPEEPLPAVVEGEVAPEPGAAEGAGEPAQAAKPRRRRKSAGTTGAAPPAPPRRPRAAKTTRAPRKRGAV